MAYCVLVKAIRCASLVVLMGVACGDSSPQVDSSTDAGSTTTMGLDSVGNASSPVGTSTTDPTATDTSPEQTGSSTGPAHQTDFGLCEIEVACDQTIVDEPKRNCNLTVTEADGYVVYDGPAGLENRGRSSQGWPKHQYAVELWQSPNIELVAPGASWLYNDGPSVGAANWMDPEFDDSGWTPGVAPFGYGLLGLQWAQAGQIPSVTTIGFGPNAGNKYITSWYRHDFEIADLATLDPVVLNLRIDDGAVVYINGTEVARYNMPTGPIGATTLANTLIDSLEEIEFTDFPVARGVLIDGTNTIAVELHQGSTQSNDVAMDLSLSTSPVETSVSFFDFGRESDWIFNGIYFDLSLYRNKLIYDLFAAFDPVANYGPETQYCTLTLNGDPRGIYTLGEKIKRDDDRVDIAQEMGAGETFIFKSDATKIWVTTGGVGWQLVYPDTHNMSQTTADGLTSFMQGFEAATVGNGNVWDYVDMQSAVDWVLLQEFTLNGDAYYSSTHIFKDNGGKIKFAPWDFDIGLGGGCGDPEDWIFRPGGLWINGLTNDPVFRAAFVARWTELRQTLMSDTAINARIDAYAATMTAEKIAENFQLWPQDEIIGGDDWVLPFREDCPVESWQEEDEVLRAWITARLFWMDENIQSFG